MKHLGEPCSEVICAPLPHLCLCEVRQLAIPMETGSEVGAALPPLGRSCGGQNMQSWLQFETTDFIRL